MKKVQSLPGGGAVYSDGHLKAMISLAGKKHWKRVDSIEDAKTWADGLRSRFTGSLTKGQLAEAIQAYALLPKGVSLLEALKKGLDRIGSPETDKPVSEAVQEYLEEKRASQSLTERTLSEYTSELKKFAAAFPSDVLGVSRPVLAKYICGIGTPYQQMHMRIAVSAFFSWCKLREYVKENPADGIVTAPIKKSNKGILTPAQTKKILSILVRRVREAKDDYAKERARKMVTYSALCLFGGLRPMEAFRLPAEDIHDSEIYVSDTTAKSHGHQERTVPINATLKAWLTAYPARGSMTTFATISGAQQYLGEVKAEAGLTGNTQDIFRHSAGSYWLQIEGDSAKIALWLGHTQDVANTHYRNKRVTKKDAEEYFSLTPKVVRGR